jgi:hypothetical protein
MAVVAGRPRCSLQVGIPGKQAQAIAASRRRKLIDLRFGGEVSTPSR